MHNITITDVLLDKNGKQQALRRHNSSFFGLFKASRNYGPLDAYINTVKMGKDVNMLINEGMIREENLSYNRVGVIFQNDGNKNTRCTLYNQDGTPLAISNHRPYEGRETRQTLSTTFEEIPGRSGDCMDELRRQAGKHRFSKGYTVELTQPNNQGGIKMGIAHFNVYTRK